MLRWPFNFCWGVIGANCAFGVCVFKSVPLTLHIYMCLDLGLYAKTKHQQHHQSRQTHTTHKANEDTRHHDDTRPHRASALLRLIAHENNIICALWMDPAVVVVVVVRFLNAVF